MDKTILTDHRTSRTMRADIGLNGDDDDKLREIATKHFGRYNRSLMIRTCVTLFLKLYHNVYKFEDDVMMDRLELINTDIEPVLEGFGEPRTEPLTNLDNVTDPYRIIKGVKAISRYIGMSPAWVSTHKEDLIDAGVLFKMSRGRIGGVTYCAIPYFIATYFSAKYQPDSYPHGGFKR